jgi:DNA polymerase-3 subunit chi
MSASVSYYHLMITPHEKVVPRLVEKIYKSGLRTVIVTKDEEQLKAMNTVLWTFSTLAFLPHGCKFDCADVVDQQPIWVTDTFENPNQASVCVVCDDHTVEIPTDLGFNRYMYVFDATQGESKNIYQKRRQLHETLGDEQSAWIQTAKGWTAET